MNITSGSSVVAIPFLKLKRLMQRSLLTLALLISFIIVNAQDETLTFSGANQTGLTTYTEGSYSITATGGNFSIINNELVRNEFPTMSIKLTSGGDFTFVSMDFIGLAFDETTIIVQAKKNGFNVGTALSTLSNTTTLNGTSDFIGIDEVVITASGTDFTEMDNIDLDAVVSTNPTFNSVPVTSLDEGETYNYEVKAEAANGGYLIITAPTLPSWLTLQSTPNIVTTVGGSGSAGTTDGTGTSALFNGSAGVVIDINGNLYIADSQNNLIRKMTPAGVVTTVAGSGLAGSADGTGTSAEFNFPIDLTLDNAGNIYVAEFSGHRIRMINSLGVVTTIAGNGNPGFVEGTGTNAEFNQPAGIAIDGFGNLFVADDSNQVIRRLTAEGVVSTFVGGHSSGTANGTGSEAGFLSPKGIDIDELGNLYIAESGGHQIRKVTPSGVVSTIAGNGSAGTFDGMGSAASFNAPWGVSVDSYGNIFVADLNNNLIRKVTSGGLVTTLAGGGSFGSVDGTGTSSQFNSPLGAALDAQGNLYIGDFSGHRIRKISLASTKLTGNSTMRQGSHSVTLIADDDNGGTAEQSFVVQVIPPNTAPVVDLDGATSGAINENGSIGIADYATVTDADNDNIVSMTVTATGYTGSNTDQYFGVNGATNTIATNAGVTISAYDANTGVMTFTGSATAAIYQSILNGIVYINESNNPPAGDVVIRIEVNDGTVKSSDVTNTITITPVNDAPTFTSLPVITVNDNATYSYAYTTTDAEGDNVTVTATSKPSWLSVSAQSITSTVAGSTLGSADGTGTNAQFNFPSGLALDAAGNIYVADGNNNSIRKITSAGVVSILAGGSSGSTDGSGAAAKFQNPNGLAVDLSGNIYVADGNNNSIRKITPAGVVSTLAGGTNGTADGSGTSAHFNYPTGVAVDASGNVFVADRYNNRIRKITPAGVVTTFAGTTSGDSDGTGTAAQFSAPGAIALDGSGNLYVADAVNHSIRKITPDAVVTTLAGGSSGSADGSGTAAQFNFPRGVAVDGTGNVYVADGNNNIRQITSVGLVTTMAGSGSGFLDGTAAQFASVDGVAVDASGNVYVADGGNHRIRKVTQPQNVLSGDATGQISGNQSVTLTANDGKGGMTPQIFNINVVDVTNPSLTSGTAVSFAENGTGTAYTITATDANAVTYSLGNGNDEILFDLTGEAVTFKSAPDFENPADGNTDNAYVINVIATDGINSVNQDVIITVTNVDDTAPVFTSITTVNFAENGTGTAYTVTATDANQVSYALGTGNDEGLFNISGGVVTFKATPDFEVPTDGNTDNAYVINVNATDGINSVNQNVIITVTNVDDTAPVFTSITTVNFAENGIGTAFTAVATDANAVTYSLGTGNDEDLFNISGGVVTFKVAPDFEVPTDGDNNNTYVIEVKANDGPNTVSQTVNITVTNVNDNNPIFTSQAVTSVNAETEYDYAFTATDGDGDELTFTAPTLPTWLTFTAGSIQANTVSTFAGGGSTANADGTGIEASFTNITAITSDTNGNVYVANSDNNTIRKVTPTGVVTTLATNVANVVALAAKGNGDVYAAEATKINKITQAGVVTTFIGSGIVSLTDMVIDSRGTLYWTDLNSGVGKLSQAFTNGSASIGEVSVIHIKQAPAPAGPPTPGGPPAPSTPSVPGTATISSVSSVTPGGAKAVGDVIEIKVIFSEAVNVTGTPQLTLETGDTDRTIDYSGGSGSTTLIFNYTIQQGDKFKDLNYVDTNSLTLGNGGIIKSAIITSNDAVLTLPSITSVSALASTTNFSIGYPVVTNVSSSTADGTKKFGETVEITVTFSEPVNVTGTPKLKLETGSTDQSIAYNGIGSSTNTLSFSYTVQEGDNSTDLDYQSASALTLEGGTLKDADGDDAIITLPTPGSTGSLAANKSLVIDALFEFNSPSALAIDKDHNLFVVVDGTDIVKFDALYAPIVNIPGVPPSAPAPLVAPTTNVDFLAFAQFDSSLGKIAIGKDGLLYAFETDEFKLQQFDNNGTATVFAGSGTGSRADGIGTSATFTDIKGLAIDPNGNLYAAETDHVRQIKKEIAALKGTAPATAGTHNVVLKADDNNGGTAEQSFTITVNDVTDPVFTSGTAVNFAENGTGTTYTVTATDANQVSYALGTGNDEGLFNISGGVVTFKVTPDFEVPTDGNTDNAYVINVIATDGINSVNQNVIITVTNVDDTAPVFTSNSTIAFAENGTSTVHTAVATDVGAITYSLGAGKDNGLFNIQDGEITFKVTPDFEQPSDNNVDNIYAITLVATDASNNASSQNVNINVTNVDDTAPVLTSISTASFVENGTGTVYSATATDVNAVTYNLGTGNDESLFNIQGGIVTFKTAPDFEQPGGNNANNTYVINVIATDLFNNTSNQNVTITVTNVDDTAPVLTSTTTASFAENGTGTVYSATATDANAVTYNLGTGNDENLFNIQGGIVTFKTAPDFEQPGGNNANNTYVINLIATDDNNNTSNQDVTITVTNVDDTAPVFTSSTTATFVENELGTIYTALATDVNAVTYSLGTGNDEDLFNNLEGAITFKSAPNFEQPGGNNANNTYVINLIATDENNNTSNQNVTITVTNVSDVNPVFTSQPVITVNDNAIYAYAISTSDADGDKVTVTATNKPSWLSLVGVVGSEVTTFAGTGSGTFADGSGTSAGFNGPQGIAVDGNGNVYVADSFNKRVRKIDAAGNVTTLAGNGSSGVDDGPGTSASFMELFGLVLDAAGNVYVSDQAANTIRKITPTGDVSTFAGSGSAGSTNGQGTSATLRYPRGLGIDAFGNIYVAEPANNLIRKITQEGIVSTFVGSGTFGAADGQGTEASFSGPTGIAVDELGNLYVSDASSSKIRKITSAGYVSTIAGSGSPTTIDGSGIAASFNSPSGMAVDAANNVYVVETNGSTIRKIDPDGNVTTLAGTGLKSSVNGTGTSASFNNPRGVAIDRSGNLYVTEETGHNIRKISSEFVLTGDANGLPTGIYDVTLTASDGIGQNVTQAFQIDVADVTNPIFTSATALSFAENGQETVYTIVATDVNPISYSLGTGKDEALFDISGPTISFKTAPDFETPADSNTDNIYTINVIANDGTNTISQDVTITVTNESDVNPVFTSQPVITINDDETYNYAYSTADVDGDIVTVTATNKPSWITLDSSVGRTVTTFAGSGNEGFVDGIGTLASFEGPSGIVIDGLGNLFVADSRNRRIRKIDLAGNVTTFAGSGQEGSNDGQGTAASFNEPFNMVINSDGDLFVTDQKAHNIRKITTAGLVTTFAGSGSPGAINGNGTFASFNEPFGIAVDSEGNLYVTDTKNNSIRKIQPNGEVSTFAGSGTAGAVNAQGLSASFNFPISIAIDKDDNLYVTEAANHVIRKIDKDANVTTYAGIVGSAGSANGTGTMASFTQPAGIVIDASNTIYLTEYDGQRIRKIDANQVVTTLAGTGTAGSADGIGTGASFHNPLSLALDENGTIYIAEAEGHRIRKISPDFRLTGDATGQPAGVQSVTLTANDGNGGTATQIFNINVIDVTSPVLTSAIAANYAENGTGTAYTVTATDANAVTYSLGTGNDEDLFNISNGVVTFKTSPDFEIPTDGNTDNAYVINMIATDANSNAANQNVTITVTNVDDTKPVFTSGLTVNYAENGSGSVYTIAATDANTVTYSLGAGNDESLFDLTGGVVTFKTSPDFENAIDGDGQNTYEIEVNATDGLNTATQTVVITVTDVDEILPVFTSAIAANYAENGTGTAYTVTATDANAVTYSLGTGNDEDLFNISNGVVTFKTSPDFEIPTDGNTDNAYVINMIATDANSNAANQNVTITVTNVDDTKPVFTSPL
ncbi:SMP-30/gluconolactonase/LRE family protein, partial [Roseivirga sp.]|uniref:SMP-30/gluconolactonase/LRE family protein n=1 Tax=Roseivirga sp. TaxID=1964215 RepID=UPI003B8BE980